VVDENIWNSQIDNTNISVSKYVDDGTRRRGQGRFREFEGGGGGQCIGKSMRGVQYNKNTEI